MCSIEEGKVFFCRKLLYSFQFKECVPLRKPCSELFKRKICKNNPTLISIDFFQGAFFFHKILLILFCK